MTVDRDEKGCICGGAGAGAVNLHQISSIVHDVLDLPCVNNSSIKGQHEGFARLSCHFLKSQKFVSYTGNRMLKREKWRSIFDGDGRAFGFKKALKLIVLGGVDPSIRAEVWEFLLGCYRLGSTAEYQRQLRMARRERYNNLIKQCQTMHSSIGTGTLPYVIGSKVMDARTTPEDGGHKEAEVGSMRVSQDTINDIEANPDLSNQYADGLHACQREISSNSADLVSVGGSTEDAIYDSSYTVPSDPHNCVSPKAQRVHGSQYETKSYFDFPPLPVTNLFEKNNANDIENEALDKRVSTKQRFSVADEPMHSFQINNNMDQITESSISPSTDVLHTNNGEIEMFSSNVQGQELTDLEHKNAAVNRERESNVPKATINSTTSGATAVEERVSEWLWTLHRIVVDVVRTDSHLEFYEDTKNIARMSDILAVYAWVDPATGYCQGMSDLLSPFIVLYEDNADAFWCFEMLLRRMRENFQIEGPTRVLEQLQSLWKILEQIDAEMFKHLSLIGAESLHFAFPMLLVLFRRELSFSEALRMWEMMWAADFDEAVTQELEDSCLEPLVLHLPSDSGSGRIEEHEEDGNGKRNSEGEVPEVGSIEEHSPSENDGMGSASSYPFCGLGRATFWAKHDHLQICTVISSMSHGNDELPVFCVAAALIINRQKILKETLSIDDVIKMFNDKMLKITVKRCIRMAIKLRKKYSYKIVKQTSVTCSK